GGGGGSRSRRGAPLGFLALFLGAASSPPFARVPPPPRGGFYFSFGSVLRAPIASPPGGGYKNRAERPCKRKISPRRALWEGRRNEEEGAKELKQIYQPEPRVGIDVRGMSEYYVALTARIHASGGKSELDVAAAKITAVFRRRGGAGAPLPVALTSNGFLEQE